MKSGTYIVSFVVDLVGVNSHEEAEQAVADMVYEAMADEEFPNLAFELVEEFDEEYQVDEEEVAELNFDEAV